LRTSKENAFLVPLLVLVFLSMPLQAWSGETGHYYPGVANVRDFTVPPAGFYYVQYNGYYSSDTYRNVDGDKIDTVEVAGKKVDVDTNLESYVILPTFIWSTQWKILGARYAAFVQPSFGKGSIEAAAELLAGEISSGQPGPSISAQPDSSWGVGDLYVQPVWLNWHWTHFDMSTAAGVYAPIGRYTQGAADNIGLGYWSFDFNLNGVYYPFNNPATALSATAIYEINTNRDGVDVRPGDHFTFELGISQYLSEQLELGLFGYGQWQVTDDSGADAVNKGDDQLYGIGGQLAYWFVKQKFYVSARYVKQLQAKDRFEGQYGVLTFLVAF